MRWFIAFLALCVGFTSSSALAQGKRPIVAIYEIEDLSGNNLAQTFSTMIETAITGTNKFRVVERSGVNKLLREQGGTKSGLLSTNRPGKVGGFEGADYLVYGTITSISSKQKSNLGASLLSGLGSNGPNPNCSNTIVSLEADIKITDASSGEVRYATRISEVQKGSTSCGTSGQIDSAALLRGAADKVATGLVIAIYPMQIAAVQPDGSFVLNYGAGAVTQGAIMTVFQKGEAILDPATGEVLGNNETPYGQIQITDVQPRFSKAVAVSTFTTVPPVGSIVRLATTGELNSGKKKKK